MTPPQPENFSKDEIEFIRIHTDSNQPILHARREVLHAIACRKKIKSKLPSWFEHCDIVYPESIALEQASSEQTAAYKAQLLSGQRLLDLTGGFGVDDYYFSKKFDEVFYVEQQEKLAQLVAMNFTTLGRRNIQCFTKEATVFLQEDSGNYDVIYLDPARRNTAGKKTFLFENCTPNILTITSTLWQKTSCILLKASPLFDIQQASSLLQGLKEVHVVSIQNECKEILFLMEKGYHGDYVVHAIDLTSPEQAFHCSYLQEKQFLIEYDKPNRYIFEPNAAIMKTGTFKTIANKFVLKKIHPNTHLFTSEFPVPNFPGRCFELIQIIKPQPKYLKSILPEMKANLILRNFPGSAVDLKKKLGIKDGGDSYLLACTNSDNSKILLHCNRI